jgi:hypothetical protein
MGLGLKVKKWENMMNSASWIGFLILVKAVTSK